MRRPARTTVICARAVGQMANAITSDTKFFKGPPRFEVSRLIRAGRLRGRARRHTISSSTISSWLVFGVRKPGLQIGRQQPVKQLLTRFAAGGESSGAIGSGLQAALHGFANAQIFILHAVPYRY